MDILLTRRLHLTLPPQPKVTVKWDRRLQDGLVVLFESLTGH